MTLTLAALLQRRAHRLAVGRARGVEERAVPQVAAPQWGRDAPPWRCPYCRYDNDARSWRCWYCQRVRSVSARD